MYLLVKMFMAVILGNNWLHRYR